MIVRDLIKKLVQHPMDAEVIVGSGDEYAHPVRICCDSTTTEGQKILVLTPDGPLYTQQPGGLWQPLAVRRSPVGNG